MKFHFFRKADSDLAWTDFSPPSFDMSVDYLHTSARIRLPESKIAVDLGLNRTNRTRESIDGCLVLRGLQNQHNRRALLEFPNDSARLNHGEFDLPQGPFTLEAWIMPTSLDLSRGIVCNTQSSGYALFLHEGRAQFDVHLNGRYVSPASKQKLTANQWVQIAGVYDENSAHLFVDGKLIQSLPASGERTINQLPLYIGADPDGFGNPSREFAGKIDEVRLSKVARYQTEFEPKTRFKNDNDTIVLLHMDEKYGPFIVNECQADVPVLTFGKTKVIPRK
jgi:hypothetical protein